MTITKEQFKIFFPNNNEPDVWVEALNMWLPVYEINTQRRVCSFLAQCGHESGGFMTLKENLNYSAQALYNIFRKYFPTLTAAENFAKKPELIANKVYANRMGNGPESSGDGFKYRGRGPIQLTGKDNYTTFANDMFNEEECAEVLANPDLLATDKSIALKSAIWFWNKNNLNSYADAEDLTGMTKRINGGNIGLEERINKYNKIKGIIQG